jgi:hypothetical protein
LGSVPLPLPALDHIVDVGVEVGLVVLGTDMVDALRSLLPQVAPALFEKRLVEQLVAVAEPMLRVLLGLLC